MQHTSVLIVGGSLVGLSASVFLSWRNVPHILVERHRGSSPHPRAMGFTETTVEHYRTVGISVRIPQSAPEARLRRVRTTNLAADWISESDWTPGQTADRSSVLSPCLGAAIAQDKIEPILREAAVELGSELRLGVEMVQFRQVDNGVVALLRELESSREYEVCADYLIAADGANSGIRETLAISRNGVGHLRTLRSVLFECPDADRYLQRGPQQYEIENDGFHAFLTTYGDSRWVLMFDDDKDRSSEELREAVQRALGRDMPFEVIATGLWEMAGRIADRYSDGRVFLVGDAAHQLPPTRGGFGANTGIDDAWNLAWKLQRVLDGLSGPALLDTYSVERQPIGWLRHQQTFSRPDYASWVGSDFRPSTLLSNDAMEFGQIVRSSAVIGAASHLPPAAEPGVWRGQPGTRAPHIWLEGETGEISTLDLFGRNFVLLTASEDWSKSAVGVSVTMMRIGTDIRISDQHVLMEAFGIGHDGASLVRPDGIIAWRALSGPTSESLSALRALISSP
ncbi:FAD-dependent monooxygenase [Caballeronia sp. GAWG1-1]|uniref:FAD-dependent monooxygenase n=1 Tax=Caballeronia sp. GAWG1-1 TaxID=2921742 RepID=UPI002027C50A|nr:FAD-dependent monooxygenase [Caballeronia sp. GAWG1-1]